MSSDLLRLLKAKAARAEAEVERLTSELEMLRTCQPTMSRSEIRRRASMDPAKLSERYIELQDERDRLRLAVDVMAQSLRRCASASGAPDAAQGCRIVIRLVGQALSDPAVLAVLAPKEGAT